MGPAASNKIDPRPLRSKRQISDTQNAEGDPLRCVRLAPHCVLPCAVESARSSDKLPSPRSARLGSWLAFTRSFQVQFWNAWDMEWPT
jgi:hypothetical protein